MKLYGVSDGEIVIASMGRHDYIVANDLMVDGGQPGTIPYAGYTRFRGTPIWFEVPQTFAELYQDYNCNRQSRKYGVWDINNVKLLADNEIPDTESFEYRVENAIWGTFGPNGDQPLQYVHLTKCEDDHLRKIHPQASLELQGIIDFILTSRQFPIE